MLIPWYANILCYPRGYMCGLPSTILRGVGQ